MEREVYKAPHVPTPADLGSFHRRPAVDKGAPDRRCRCQANKWFGRDALVLARRLPTGHQCLRHPCPNWLLWVPFGCLRSHELTPAINKASPDVT